MHISVPSSDIHVQWTSHSINVRVCVYIYIYCKREDYSPYAAIFGSTNWTNMLPLTSILTLSLEMQLCGSTRMVRSRMSTTYATESINGIAFK